MTRLAVVLAVLALLAPMPGWLLGPAVVLVAAAVAVAAVWSYLADPPRWEPPSLWSGRFA